MTARRAFLTAVAALCALAACAGPAAAPAPTVRGPIRARVLQPAAIGFPSPRPARATVAAPGEGRALVDLQYSSIFEREVRPQRAASFDGEVARLAADLTFGVGPGVSLGIEPALYFASSGFLDATVDAFHQLTGLPGGGRESFPRDQYSMELERAGVTAWSLEEDAVLLGDLPLTLTARVQEEGGGRPAIAARLTVEAPTGDVSRGSGSGGWDTAAGVLVERSLGRWTLTGSLDGVQVDRPRAFRDAGIDVDFLLLAAAGAEYRWSDRTSLLLQLQYRSPFTDDLPFEEIDREILDIGVGLATDLGPGQQLTLSFHEDAVAASGPDFVLYAGLAFGL